MYQASSKLELAGKQLKQGEEEAGDKQTSQKQKSGESKAEKLNAEKQKASKKQKASPETVKANEKKKKKKSEKRAPAALGSPLEVDTEASKPKKKKTKRVSSADQMTPNGRSATKQATEQAIQGGQAAVKESPGVPPRRKSVRINLKKNLVRRIGEVPYPENVRTPPTSKPRGSALKAIEATNKRKKSSVKRSLKMK